MGFSRLFLTTSLCDAFAAVLFAQKRRFSDIDSNRDGVLTRSERVLRNQDGDGVLRRGEGRKTSAGESVSIAFNATFRRCPGNADRPAQPG